MVSFINACCNKIDVEQLVKTNLTDSSLEYFNRARKEAYKWYKKWSDALNDLSNYRIQRNFLTSSFAEAVTSLSYSTFPIDICKQSRLYCGICGLKFDGVENTDEISVKLYKYLIVIMKSYMRNIGRMVRLIEMTDNLYKYIENVLNLRPINADTNKIFVDEIAHVNSVLFGKFGNDILSRNACYMLLNGRTVDWHFRNIEAISLHWDICFQLLKAVKRMDKKMRKIIKKRIAV